MKRWFTILLALTLVACGKPAPAGHDSAHAPAVETAGQREPTARKKPAIDEATQIAALIDPAKLATLKSRGANPRILKITAILYAAKTSGKNPNKIVESAVAQIGWGGPLAGDITAAAIMRNLVILEELGATTPDDIAAMKKGKSPIVRRGTYAGDVVSVDHIIPVAVAPSLSNTIANLELMPLRLNQSKGDSIGPRQRNLTEKLQAAGLLSTKNLLDSAGLDKP